MRKTMIPAVVFLLLVVSVAVSVAAPKPGTGTSSAFAAFGCRWANNGEIIKISSSPRFANPPVVLTCAYKPQPDGVTNRAVSSCAVDNATTTFKISIYDENGAPVTGAWVQWIAFAPDAAKKVLGGVVQANDGQQIAFPSSLSGAVIVTNAQKSSKALNSAAVDNSSSGFKLVVRDQSNNPMQGAWVQWMAVVPGNGNAFRGGVAQLNNGSSVSASPAFTKNPAYVMSAQTGSSPFAAAAVTNRNDSICNSFVLSLIKHDGSFGGGWTQWLGYGGE